MRLFLDANVLFSAVKSDGAVRTLLWKLYRAGHQLAADGYVWEEARRNIALRYPSSLPEFTTIEKLVRAVSEYCGDEAIATTLPLRETDRPVLATAIALRCDVLITGDRSHFGALYGKEVHGVTIHSPRSIAETTFSDRSSSE